MATADPITTRYDSDWSDSVFITTDPDTTAPPAPSAPQTARLTSTSGRFRWDGLAVFGSAMPADLEAVELHLSTSASYTATSPADRLAVGYSLAADTYRGDITAGRPLDVVGLASGTTYYASFVARDTAGNRSPMSTIISV